MKPLSEDQRIRLHEAVDLSFPIVQEAEVSLCCRCVADMGHIFGRVRERARYIPQSGMKICLALCIATESGQDDTTVYQWSSR